MKSISLQLRRQTVVILLVAVGAGGGGLWWFKYRPGSQVTSQMPDYDASLAEKDYAAGQKRILVYGLNTTRPPLPTPLTDLGVSYFEVAGCAPPMNCMAGITAYNHRMRDLLQRDSGLDLSSLPVR